MQKEARPGRASFCVGERPRGSKKLRLYYETCVDILNDKCYNGMDI